MELSCGVDISHLPTYGDFEGKHVDVSTVNLVEMAKYLDIDEHDLHTLLNYKSRQCADTTTEEVTKTTRIAADELKRKDLAADFYLIWFSDQIDNLKWWVKQRLKRLFKKHYDPNGNPKTRLIARRLATYFPKEK